jgi:hypothetical protein
MPNVAVEDYHSCFVPERSRVQISAWKLDILTDVVVSLHPFKQNAGTVLSTDDELISAGCKRPWCSAGGVQSMQVDDR